MIHHSADSLKSQQMLIVHLVDPCWQTCRKKDDMFMHQR